MTVDPAIDGIFLDGNVKALVPGYLARQIGARKKKWTMDGYHLMMKQTREAIGPNELMIANILRARFKDAGLEYLGYFDGSYLEAFFHNVGDASYEEYVAKGIDAMQKAARQGKIIAFSSGLALPENTSKMGIDEGHATARSDAQARAALVYPLAVFLICAEKYSYFRVHEGYSANEDGRWMRWFPEYDRPLGPPNGPAKKDGYRYCRTFANASVILDVKRRTAEIQWRTPTSSSEQSLLGARDEYLWRVEVHGELASGKLDFRQLSEREETDDALKTLATPGGIATQTGRRPYRSAAVAVALLVLIVLGGGLWMWRALRTSTVEPKVVARYAELQDCRWMVQTTRVRTGDAIQKGQRIELSSGTAEVLFNSGACLKIFGPTILETLSGNSTFLMQGQVQVRLEVTTPESKGFTVLTPTSKFVDIGTAFTATVEPDGLSRVDVSEGEVDVVLEGIASSPRLRAGETLCIEPAERQVMTRIERGDGTAAFRFPNIDPPSSEDYADQAFGHANVRVAQGRLKTHRGQPGSADVLLDGAGQSHQDAPEESAFFEDGSRGSFLVDLGREVSVTKINSYSWHQHRTFEEHRHRALQRFTLYGYSGDQLPDMTRHLRRAGWQRVARVNTDRFFEVHKPLERPSQQACSITAARGEIGRFRYLLWVTEGFTFFGEFDVFGSPSSTTSLRSPDR